MGGRLFARINPKIYDFGHFHANSQSYWTQYVRMNRFGYVVDYSMVYSFKTRWVGTYRARAAIRMKMLHTKYWRFRESLQQDTCICSKLKKKKTVHHGVPYAFQIQINSRVSVEAAPFHVFVIITIPTCMLWETCFFFLRVHENSFIMIPFGIVRGFVASLFRCKNIFFHKCRFIRAGIIQ